MPDCMTCRWMSRKGCRAHLCAVVRSEMRGKGERVPANQVLALTWEPVGEDGLAGYLVSWATRDREFSPTSAGHRKALAFREELEALGITTEFAELRRDFNPPATTA